MLSRATLARKYIFISARSVEGASVMETKGTRGIRGICVHFAGRPREWRAISISQGKGVIRARAAVSERPQFNFYFQSDVCYICRSSDTSGVYVTRYITRSTCVSQVPFLPFHISSGKCGRNDIFTEAPAPTSTLKIFVFVTSCKWQDPVKSP